MEGEVENFSTAKSGEYISGKSYTPQRQVARFFRRPPSGPPIGAYFNCLWEGPDGQHRSLHIDHGQCLK